MKKTSIFLCLLLMFTGMVNAQYYPDKAWMQLNGISIRPDSEGTIANEALDNLVETYNATLERGFPGAVTVGLQNVYKVEINTGELDNFIQDINDLENEEIGYIEKIPMAANLYDPADYFWQLSKNNDPNDWAWWLEIIEADKAWDITKGNPNLKVAIMDDGFDIAHPDLAGKISPATDFLTGQPLYKGSSGHGSSVASILAGETALAGSTPNGDMASIGFNTKVLCSTDRSISAVHDASFNYGVKIVSISWYYPWLCNQTPSPTVAMAEKEILDNGTIIVKASGNGPTYCNGGPLYPFSGVEDDRVIIVTGTDNTDSHFNTMNSVATVSSYPAVDIAAPSYAILSAINSNPNDPNDWPYYGWGGTSQSAPIVAGVAALMSSVNNVQNSCLTSGMAQDIITSTADPIVDAANYPEGDVGSGRINAYEAVKAAQFYSSSSLDLYMKDRPEDLGYSGSYVFNWNFDKSPDIWVRNQQDGLTTQEHEDPFYSPTHTKAYVYVRVRNKSCVTSSSEPLSLYWTKASSNAS